MKMLVLTIAIAGAISLLGARCTPTEPNQLDALGAVSITIKGQPFQLWVADATDEQSRGLMFITAKEMEPLPDGTQRGMLFVFDRERHLSFWMKNTIIPLDIAYLDADGVVVSKYTMAPLDTSYNKYPSIQPAQYAIEVNADVFSDLDLKAGDLIEIP